LKPVPIIDCDEDGETFWMLGHEVTEIDARLALLMHEIGEGWVTKPEAFHAASTATLERGWYCYVDPDENDELMRPCAAEDNGAMAFTMLRLVSS
jgi:hypothetical protein